VQVARKSGPGTERRGPRTSILGRAAVDPCSVAVSAPTKAASSTSVTYTARTSSSQGDPCHGDAGQSYPARFSRPPALGRRSNPNPVVADFTRPAHRRVPRIENADFEERPKPQTNKALRARPRPSRNLQQSRPPPTYDACTSTQKRVPIVFASHQIPGRLRWA